MIILKEDGRMPDEIRIVPDSHVLAACITVHLATLCWLSWCAGSIIGKLGY